MNDLLEYICTYNSIAGRTLADKVYTDTWIMSIFPWSFLWLEALVIHAFMKGFDLLAEMWNLLSVVATAVLTQCDIRVEKGQFPRNVVIKIGHFSMVERKLFPKPKQNLLPIYSSINFLG